MIQSIKRAFDILEYISSNGNMVRLNDIAAALNLKKTTVHNFLYSLKELGYIEQDELSPRYRVTPKIQYLMAPDVNYNSIKARMRPVLEQITLATNETAYLSVQMGMYFRHELISEPNSAIKISLELNKDFEMMRTAIGKIFMANSSHLRNVLLNKLEGAERQKLEKELELVVQNDFAYDFEEYEKDLNCIAVPLRENNRIIGAVGVSGPAFRFKKAEMDSTIELVNKYII